MTDERLYINTLYVVSHWKMLKLVVLCALLVCAGTASQPIGRIVGGEQASIAQFPWQVSLQFNGNHYCGGAIYAPNIIITAAHCFTNESLTLDKLTVRAGSTYWRTGGVLLRLAAFKIHEDYDAVDFGNDIAIARLQLPLAYSTSIKPIPLTQRAPADGTPALVSGWGVNATLAKAPTPALQYIETSVISNEVCASRKYYYRQLIKPSMFCASTKEKDACRGDSGSPLVTDGQLSGVVSWGVSCAHPSFPGIYTNIATLRDWIVTNAKSLSNPTKHRALSSCQIDLALQPLLMIDPD